LDNAVLFNTVLLTYPNLKISYGNAAAIFILFYNFLLISSNCRAQIH